MQTLSDELPAHATTTPEVLYSPDSSLRSPRRLFGGMRHDLMASWELAWQLTRRDMSAKYRQAWLGIAWAFLPPIATTAVFVLLSAQRLLDSGETPVPYPVFVLLGTVFWQLFGEGLAAPLGIVTGSRSLLAKINFPREALLVSAILQVFINFAIKLGLVGIVLLWYHIPLPWTSVLVPFAAVALVLLGITLGLLLVPVGMLYTDISKALSILTTFWLFVTPVGYPPPEQGILATLTDVNPVAPLLLTARDWMTTGPSAHVGAFLWVSGVCVLFLAGGWILYRVSMPIIIERMSA